MSEIAIAMPQVFAVSPCSTKDEVSFTVINQDKLPVNMTVTGQQILKPFDNAAQKMKPNVIVHPTRRLPANSEKNNSADEEAQVTAQRTAVVNDQVAQDKRDKLRNKKNSRVKLQIEELKQQFGSNLNKVLDFKLRKLQKESKTTQNENASRKPFVTTVKKGLFLEPPPEVANLIGMSVKVEEPILKKDQKEMKKLYAFSSHPRVLNRSSPKNLHYARCEAAARAAGQIAGGVVLLKDNQFDDYKAIQEADQNNTTGRPKFRLNHNHYLFQPVEQPKWNPHFAYAKLLSKDTANKGSASARAREARRRALARKKAKNQQNRTPTTTQGGYVRNRRQASSESSQEMGIQTEQTILISTPRREDIGTQINPGDLFNFDEAVQPILEILVGKTIEKALIEVLEEEELAALGEQQRRYLENRAAESLSSFGPNDEADNKVHIGSADMNNGTYQTEPENNSYPAYPIQATVAHKLPLILEHLEDKGFSLDAFKKDFDVSFLPWLLKEIMFEIQDMVSSPDVLTDIVTEILENRSEIDQITRKKSSEDTDEDIHYTTRHDILMEY